MTEMTVLAALAAVMGEVTAVGKDRQNQQQGYAFRGADDVVAAVAPAFRRHGVISLPDVEQCHLERVPQGSKDTMMHRCTLTVLYRFRVVGSADVVEARVVAEAADSADKATAKAMTVAYRTALLQVLNLPTVDVDAVTDAMIRKLMTLFTYANIRTRQDRLGYAAEVIGREIESTKDLTSAEWQQLVASLEHGVAEPVGEEPPDWPAVAEPAVYESEASR
jgi:hypothetical protein